MLYSRYKYRARKKDLHFKLTQDQFHKLTAGNCYLCGAEPYQIYRSAKSAKAETYTYNGLDRIDNSLGYVWGNVKSCCGECNRIKSSASLTELRDKLNKIVGGIDETIADIRRDSEDQKDKEPNARTPMLRPVRPPNKNYHY